MKGFWKDSVQQGWAGFRLVRKFQGLRRCLKDWNASDFGSVQSKLSKVEKELNSIDLAAEIRPLSELERNKRSELRHEFWKLNIVVESM